MMGQACLHFDHFFDSCLGRFYGLGAGFLPDFLAEFKADLGLGVSACGVGVGFGVDIGAGACVGLDGIGLGLAALSLGASSSSSCAASNWASGKAAMAGGMGGMSRSLSTPESLSTKVF
jgi:hypothetical protein